MFLIPNLGVGLKVSGRVPNQAAGAAGGGWGWLATAGCHLRYGHLSPCNHHITVAMETSGAEPSLRAVCDVMSVVTWLLSVSVNGCCWSRKRRRRGPAA